MQIDCEQGPGKTSLEIVCPVLIHGKRTVLANIDLNPDIGKIEILRLGLDLERSGQEKKTDNQNNYGCLNPGFSNHYPYPA